MNNVFELSAAERHPPQTAHRKNACPHNRRSADAFAANSSDLVGAIRATRKERTCRSNVRRSDARRSHSQTGAQPAAQHGSRICVAQAACSVAIATACEACHASNAISIAAQADAAAVQSTVAKTAAVTKAAAKAVIIVAQAAAKRRVKRRATQRVSWIQ